jgi:hypothetical protein
MTALALPLPCRACGPRFSSLAIGERFETSRATNSASIPQIVHLLTEPMRYRQSIVRQIGAQHRRSRRNQTFFSYDYFIDGEKYRL